MGYASFKFNNQFVVFNGAGYLVSGSGKADVDVDGYYQFEAGCLYDSNGDPGFPDEVTYEIDGINSINSIEDLDIDAIDAASEEACTKRKCSVPTDDEVDLLHDGDSDTLEYFYEAVEEQLELSVDNFDNNDLVEILSNQKYEDD